MERGIVEGKIIVEVAKMAFNGQENTIENET
jgi:hypothetical protein